MSPRAKAAEPDPIARRLDILIALQLRAADQTSMADQIRTLRDLGLEPPEIGRIVGKPGNYVGAVLGKKAKKKPKVKRK
jgi:hypothetical protein